jgi:hypothetical protein
VLPIAGIATLAIAVSTLDMNWPARMTGRNPRLIEGVRTAHATPGAVGKDIGIVLRNPGRRRIRWVRGSTKSCSRR